MGTRQSALAISATVLLASAASAVAGTESLSETGYDVTTRLGERITLPNGNALIVNALSHETIVNDKTGEQASEWCSYDTLQDAKGAVLHYLSYCTRIYDDGDVLWSTAVGDDAVTSKFTIAGGTGKFSGATGGGVTTTPSMRGDGRGTTFKNVGTLTTK